MGLTMRPAGLSSGIDQDRADYTVFCGEWNIGRIYEVRGGPEHLRWFWALHFPSKPEPPIERLALAHFCLPGIRSSPFPRTWSELFEFFESHASISD
jgi:hypothetical protein